MNTTLAPIMAYACTGISDDTMHPNPADPTAVAKAKDVCNRCTVATACLQDGLALADPQGVWGGYTHYEIHWLKAGIQPRPCADCGMSIVPRAAHQKRCGICSLASAHGPRKGSHQPDGQVPACGTPAALRRHQELGEPVDDVCAEAQLRRCERRNEIKRQSRRRCEARRAATACVTTPTDAA